MQSVNLANADGEFVQIQLIPLSQIEKLDGILWDRNSKKHDIDQISQSIERYGYISPAKWDQNLNGGKGGIVAGNGRTEALVRELIAARTAGREPPRGIPIDKTTGEWLIPIEFGVDCESEAEAMALAIDHNNLQMTGFNDREIARLWESEGYLAVLSEIADAGVAPVSVDEEAIADMLLLIADGQENAELGEDGIEAVLDAGDDDDYVVRVKEGEIWRLGRHLIACGDCTIDLHIKKLQQISKCSSIDMIWADPPYGINAVDNEGGVGSKTKGKYQKVIGDQDGSIAKISHRLYTKLFPQSQQIFWGANHFASTLPDSSCWIVWDKQGGKSVDFADCELAWTNMSGAARIFTHIWDGFRRDSEQGETRVHPTQKPVELFVWFAGKYGKDGDTVCDPFLGSGMSIMGAEKTGDRTVIGFEISPRYCSITIDRWERLTGQTAQLAGNL